MIRLYKCVVQGDSVAKVSLNTSREWVWIINVFKNGKKLDQMRSKTVPDYFAVQDFLRLYNVSGLTSPVMKVVYQFKKEAPQYAHMG